MLEGLHLESGQVTVDATDEHSAGLDRTHRPRQLDGEREPWDRGEDRRAHLDRVFEVHTRRGHVHGCKRRRGAQAQSCADQKRLADHIQRTLEYEALFGQNARRRKQFPHQPTPVSRLILEVPLGSHKHQVGLRR